MGVHRRRNPAMAPKVLMTVRLREVDAEFISKVGELNGMAASQVIEHIVQIVRLKTYDADKKDFPKEQLFHVEIRNSELVLTGDPEVFSDIIKLKDII